MNFHWLANDLTLLAAADWRQKIIHFYCCYGGKQFYPVHSFFISYYKDYPSVSQIATKIREKSVNLIFAVTKEQLDIYEKLSKYIEGSEATMLANDSSNIVKVIKENYEVGL